MGIDWVVGWGRRIIGKGSIWPYFDIDQQLTLSAIEPTSLLLCNHGKLNVLNVIRVFIPAVVAHWFNFATKATEKQRQISRKQQPNDRPQMEPKHQRKLIQIFFF